MAFHGGYAGGRGAVVYYTCRVNAGWQFPVVIGNGGEGGTFANVSIWQDYMNGKAGGATSFGTIVAPGGGGGTQMAPGVDGVQGYGIDGTPAAFFQVGNCGTGGAAATADWHNGSKGSPGFVVVIYG